jgi:cellulose synthase (UDP-forming)
MPEPVTSAPGRIPYNVASQSLYAVRVALPACFAITLLYLLELSIDQFDKARQLFLSWSVLVLLLATFKWQLIKRPIWRFIFILVNGFVALRYLIWRTTESLIYTGLLDFIAMALLFLAEIYAISIHFLGMFVNFWPLRNRPALLPDDQAIYPTVDVFIPTYNEDDEIIRITAIAATQLDYPKEKLKIYICDDGGTVNKRNQADSAAAAAAWERHYRLRRMARELGVEYLTRETNRSAKAGNINHALNHTTGELVLILDCDHVPTHDFLARTVEYFLADPKLFLVQTPHFFINPTPVEKNVTGVGNPNGENDMFYREIHRSLDFWNSSFFCGSAAVLRRKYLMEVGGISGSTITEDAETSLKLHSMGYNSAYLDRPMVCGLSPESYDDYIVQRTRWAQGMTQLFMMHNPLLTKGLGLHQRLCYLNSCFFWFFGFARFMFYIAPAFFLLLGLKIYHASISQILIYSLPYVLSTFLLMDFFYGRTREPFFSELYESVQCMFLIPAVASVIRNPHHPTFKVTPKGKTNTSESLNPLSIIFMVAITINLLSIIAGIFKWFTDPLLRDTLLITGAWSIYNLFLLTISLGAFWERKQVRYFHRIRTREKAKVTIPRLQMQVDALVDDISLKGMGIRLQTPFMPYVQDRVIIEVSNGLGRWYSFEGRLQRVSEHGGWFVCGVEFILDDVKYAEAVSYVYGDSSRWLAKWMERSKSGNLFKMLAHLFRMGVKGFILSAGTLGNDIRNWLQSLQTIRPRALR